MSCSVIDAARCLLSVSLTLFWLSDSHTLGGEATLSRCVDPVLREMERCPSPDGDVVLHNSTCGRETSILVAEETSSLVVFVRDGDKDLDIFRGEADAGDCTLAQLRNANARGDGATLKLTDHS